MLWRVLAFLMESGGHTGKNVFLSTAKKSESEYWNALVFIYIFLSFLIPFNFKERYIYSLFVFVFFFFFFFRYTFSPCRRGIEFDK